MNYAFHPLAKAELAEAADYYEECRPGLGDEFLKEIYSAIQRILLFPTPGPVYQRIREDVW